MKARNFIAYSGAILLPLFLYSLDVNFTITSVDSTLSNQNIAYCFAHGLGATQEQAELFITHNIIHNPCVLFNFPDAKNNAMEYHKTQVNLGQEVDIQCLKENIEKAQIMLPYRKFILAGISRGSATIANYVALHQPESIAALVLESPFDSFENIVKHLLYRFRVHWLPWAKKIAYKIAKNNFPLLDINGIFPINIIHKIPATIPVMIIHSRRDKTIPVNSSRNLYRSLRASGHPNVYLLELASGDHGKLVYSLEADLYKYVLNSFYAKFNLPHNSHFAQIGKNILNHCQPTVEEVNKRIQKTRNTDFSLDENENNGFYKLISDFDFDEIQDYECSK